MVPISCVAHGLLLRWPGFDHSLSGYIDEQSSASGQGYASDLSAIGGVVTWLIHHIPPQLKSYALKWQPFLLDMVNKSWTHAAEMFFIVFIDPENIRLDIKVYFYLVGKISRKFDVGTQWPFWKVTFLIVLTVFERGNQFNSISDRKYLQYKNKEPNIPDLAHKLSAMSLLRFGLRIFGTQLAAISYLVNKSSRWRINVAEMYFIWFVDP